MANMYNINALSYDPTVNPEWFTRALFGGRLIQSGIIRVLTGIKGDELLSQIDLQNKILQLDGKDCAWTPNQIIKLSEKRASVKTYKINLEQCIDELENKRTVYSLSPGAKNESLPDDLEAATLALIAIGLSNEIEEMLIGGDESKDPNQFNGLQKTLLLSDEAAQLVGVTLTKANILDKVAAVYNELSEDVLQAEDAGTLYVFGSYNARRLLRDALSGVSNQTITANWTIDAADPRNPRIYYLGVEFIPVKGIEKNTLIGIDATNAFMLTDLLSDLEDIELGQYPKPNDDKVWIKGRLRLGFVVPFEDEAVIMSPAITTYQAANHGGGKLEIVPTNLVFSAAGETKTFTVLTDTGVTPEVNAELFEASGFDVTVGTTTAGVTTVTVVASSNAGNLKPRTAEVLVSLPGDVDRSATLMLEQKTNDVDNIES